jgi:hypothetical protein
MFDVKSLVFVGMLMQGLGTLFLTIQLWGPAWRLERALDLKNEKGNWIHLVRDGVLLQITGTIINMLSISYWFVR